MGTFSFLKLVFFISMKLRKNRDTLQAVVSIQNLSSSSVRNSEHYPVHPDGHALQVLTSDFTAVVNVIQIHPHFSTILNTSAPFPNLLPITT